MAANNSVSFNLSNPNAANSYAMSTTINLSVTVPNLLSAIKGALQQIAPAQISSVKQISHVPSTWIEFQIIFYMTTPNPHQPQLLVAHSTNSNIAAGNLVITRLLTGYNYPLFYDNLHPIGYSGSGRYTCYKHMQNLTAWSYYTGNGNKGVISEVYHCYMRKYVNRMLFINIFNYL